MNGLLKAGVMTNNGKEPIISTGSSNLYFVNPDNFKIINRKCLRKLRAGRNINELEYVNGVVYANHYLTQEIIRIDPESGKVTGKDQLIISWTVNGVKYDPSKL